uniref:LEM domain containing 1 n=1 Tax=Oryctolagus cuniculus TaxID=9986 RepID=G1SWU0_RABIT|nr:LEM domain-containing protein 1 isoform X1 [Oryctolagus cuniculus]XP_051677191.1 LEM domain-containing protein 1 isoform X1 [Oryctolagus cuniculus]
MVDVRCLSDCELQNRLEELGFSPGPILPSTRKVYEKKVLQLLASAPCASPVPNRPVKLEESPDSDDSEELSIVLKGNIRLSAEKSKELKKNPGFERPEEQEDNCDCNNFKVTVKRPEPSASKSKSRDARCLGRKLATGTRCAARPCNSRVLRPKAGGIARKPCAPDQSEGIGFPVGLKLAVLGIFIIVVFVYITMEKRPLFG